MSSFGKEYNNYLGYALSFFGSLSFTLPIWTFFLVQYLGFSFSQAALISVINMVTTTIFEIPSGSWADLYGRKKVLFWGRVINILAFTTYLWAANFWIFIISGLFAGIGGAMMSGCLSSLIYDRFKDKAKDQFSEYTRITSMLRFFGRVVGCFFAGYLFVINPYLPYRTLLVVKILLLIITAMLFDKNYKKINSKVLASGKMFSDTITYIKKAWNEFVLADEGHLKKILITFTAGFVFAGALWDMYQPLFESIGISISNIGILYAVFSGLSLLGSWMTKFIYDGKERPFFLLYAFLLIISATGIILFLPGYGKLLGLVIIQISFGRYRPVIETYVNHQVGSAQRATINSIISLVGGLDTLLGGIFAGIVFDSLGLNGMYWSLIVGGGVLFLISLTLNKR